MKARKIVGAAVVAVTIATPMSLVSSPAAARPVADPGTCDATRTTPAYRGKVPGPKAVLGFELGDRETTSAESDRYLDAVAKSSERVVSGVLATSAQGRPLKYAIVGRPEVIRPPGWPESGPRRPCACCATSVTAATARPHGSSTTRS